MSLGPARLTRRRTRTCLQVEVVLFKLPAATRQLGPRLGVTVAGPLPGQGASLSEGLPHWHPGPPGR
eukprot:3619774-Rhodomonas_salina.1